MDTFPDKENKSAPSVPKVSVRLMTYNHEEFIEDALRSILAQNTPFPFEIVVGDDSSTDRTPEILDRYHKDFPERLSLLPRPERLGSRKNAIDILKNCHGEYIALIDGDDYWTDPFKLQKQAQFLDSHTDCSLCFHNVTRKYSWDDHPDESGVPSNFAEITEIDDLLVSDYPPTSSVMFRNHLIVSFPDWYYEIFSGDWPLFVMLAQHGKIGYIDEVMGVYRMHPGGLWTGLQAPNQLKYWIETRRDMINNLGVEYQGMIQSSNNKLVKLLPALISFMVKEVRHIDAVKEIVKKSLTELQEELNLGSSESKDVWKCVYSDYFFRSYALWDRRGIFQSLPKMLTYAPGMAFNRGVISISVQALLGRRKSR
jgi:glycosyltransferase involved in cell wall biosynthesis